MKLFQYADIWWGPPKKISEKEDDRKVSWLELFYDLVYIIAIATITHHLAAHFSGHELRNYIFLFGMIYWGWLNGSMHHDLHGASGLRTMLLTLYQMMIVAALSVVLQLVEVEEYGGSVTIVLMILQLFITYIWWSVGLYDRTHRRYSWPYIICNLLVFLMMLASLYVDDQMAVWLLVPILIVNYLPPFISNRSFKNDNSDYRLSASMNERLGLFTIIIFGEVVLGVVNGVVELGRLDINIWINFALCIGIVFSLWWVFFSLVSNRNCKSGFVKSAVFELLYLPTLISLALIGISLSGLFIEFLSDNPDQMAWSKHTFGYALGGFLMGVSALMSLLDYGQEYVHLKIIIQRILIISALVFILFTVWNLQLNVLTYLVTVQAGILLMILIFNYGWFRIMKSMDRLEEFRPSKKSG